ncbi:unnamed protein product [Arabis nemorensis]|uniref:Pentatricopeptide repeat-containing protein n=1 Tax=Arabis nemorensis TaxID=586526 RepID=A0A565BZY3_9BRAS|nr:unnamed protein product [Arabis nemorensis]
MEKKMKRMRTMNLCKRDCYHFLMISNVTEVYRIWGLLKKSHPQFSNANYHAVLQALSELRDIDGIKKLFADPRCKGTRPFVKIRELLMMHLLENDQADLALKQFKEVVSVTVKNPSKWWSKVLANKEELAWSSNLIRSFFFHFDKAKDVDGAEEFCKNLAKWSPLPLDSETYTLVMKIYVASGKLCPFMWKRLERHGIQLDQEQEDLLRKICP